MSVQVRTPTVVLILKTDEVDKQLAAAAATHLNLAARSMEVIAKELAPFDTGHMEDHIQWINPATAENLETSVESQANYSLYVEFGTVNMDAQPFFTPAFESAKRQLDKVQVF